jgi:formiminotetrahydrofolate cyclodeaminase
VQLLELTVHEWLEGLANDRPAPGGGSAAAVAGAMAAALVAMVARSSEEWEEGRGAAAQALALRDRLGELAQVDADVYERSLETLSQRAELSPERRDYELGSALSRAAKPPLEIAETAADVAVLAGDAARRADPQLHPDAAVAAALAAAAAQAAARLVEVNLSATRNDPRVEKARMAAETAMRALRRSLSSD